MVPAPERFGRLLLVALSVICVGWAAVLVLAPVARAAGALSLTDGPYLIGALVCHQRADRSFFSQGVQWPVCARCAGLYLSAAVGVVMGLVASRGLPSPAQVPRPWRVALVAAGVPTLVSWMLERADLWAVGSGVRAGLAVPLGAGVGALLASLVWHAGRAQKLG